MGFVDHDQIPRGGMNVRRLVVRELIGADDDAVGAVERAKIARLHCCIVGLGLNDRAGNEKLLIHFLMPLFAKV